MADTEFADAAPSGKAVTDYDVDHAALYIRLMDAEAAGQDWKIIASQVFGLDVERDPDRAQRVVESHLARALWMRDAGYKGLLRGRPETP
jgi:Uncharacterized conserved protein (DUF2285)